jgi:tungstate transport system ATP-binding protein
MQELLRLQDIRRTYNGRPVLHIDELAIGRGTITGLAGPNGSGKSTLLRVMSLAEKVSSGTVLFAGRPVRPFAMQVRRRIALLPQQNYLLRRTVAANIAFGLRVRGQTRNTGTAVEEALGMVGLDPAFAARQWHELSGGEAQRVALAARLVLRPDFLLLDEPTASVDLQSARSIRRAVLRARSEWGTTLVIASHHRSWLYGLCDEIINLYNGRILRCSFDNVLLGPWEINRDGEYFTRLADGQPLYVSPPPRPGSSGVLAPEALLPADREPGAGEKPLKGLITGITFDRQEATPRLHVICGDHAFVAVLPGRERIPSSCLPGQHVTLLYRPGDVAWLE